MATKESSESKIVINAANCRYDDLQLESDETQSLRNNLRDFEDQLSRLNKEIRTAKTQLLEALIFKSGLQIGDTVSLRRIGDVQIVDFFFGYEAIIEREILCFNYSKINKNGSVNCREKPKYNQASVIQIAKEEA